MRTVEIFRTTPKTTSKFMELIAIWLSHLCVMNHEPSKKIEIWNPKHLLVAFSWWFSLRIVVFAEKSKCGRAKQGHQFIALRGSQFFTEFMGGRGLTNPHVLHKV